MTLAKLTKPDKVVICKIWDSEGKDKSQRYKSAYSIIPNNRHCTSSVSKLADTNVNIIKRDSDGYFYINKKILPEKDLKKIYDELMKRAKEEGEFSVWSKQFAMLKDSTIKDLYSKSKEIMSSAKNRLK